MRCIKPIDLQGDTNGLMVRVRCGQCKACRLRKKQSWVGRLLLENREHKFSRFLTLTYREDPGVLNPEHLTAFMKSYRYHHSDKGPCRFFGVGEYGEKTNRGHWHVIIFGHQHVTRGPLRDEKSWTHGFVGDGWVSPASITYVAGYTLKKWENLGGTRPPVVRMSRMPGIGLPALYRMGADLAALNQGLSAWPHCFRFGGRLYPISDGGLIALQKGFLENGGVAPLGSTPEELDLQARLTGLGVRVFESKALAVEHWGQYDKFKASSKITREL